MNIGLVWALVFSLAAPLAARAAPDPLAGAWTITAKRDDGAASATLTLKRDGEAWTGVSGSLDALGFEPLALRGRQTAHGLQLSVTADGAPVGEFVLEPQGEGLVGRGLLYGTAVTLSAARPPVLQPGGRVFDFEPTVFRPVTSGDLPPVLRLRPGDTVRTRTVDAYGVDELGRHAGMPGNPGTGPFYVEGAMPGDTVSIRILGLRPNRATAMMGVGQLDPRALPPGYRQDRAAERESVWMLDAEHGTAGLKMPSDRLKAFRVRLRPMLGVVAVAPPADLRVPNSDLGEWGGNLDYPDMAEGTTLYLPVWQPGAMIYLGDAHARQGDGEVAGQGLETSMAVVFQVGLTQHQILAQPWAEDADFVMVSGIGGSLDDAQRRATAGMATWLKQRYGLDDTDVAAVLGSSLQYDIAEVVDPKVHVVAKISKTALAGIAPAP